MLDDLIRLKKEQEDKKYVALDVFEPYIHSGEYVFSPQTIEEIEMKENTIEFIKQCEELLRDIILFLETTTIKFDEIRLHSMAFLACKKGFAERFVNSVENGDHSLINEIESNISLKYVPLMFGLDISDLETKTDDKCIYENLVKLQNNLVSGFVDLNILINVMNEMGYSVEIEPMNGEDNVECTSIEDYIKYQKNYTDFMLNIVADFTKELKNENSYGNQIKR